MSVGEATASYKLVNHNGRGHGELNLGSAVTGHLDMSVGDRADVYPAGNGLLVVPEGEAWDVPDRLGEQAETSAHAHERDDSSPESPFDPFEARVAGNRLWELAEYYMDNPDIYEDHAKEVKQLARKLHSLAGTRGGDGQ